ncbi:MAG: energy transducer TonB [Pseudomonadota bacterium]|nr:energy transducer TonB [Pseudomonadota bacterium]
MLRFGASLAVAAVATFAVFWMMQSLISTGGSVLNEQDYGKLQSFIMSKPDDDVQTKDRKPKKPPAPPQEPPQPDMPKPDIAKADTSGFDIGGFDLGADLNVDAGLSGAGTGDGEYLPIVKVAPTYPRRAAQRGIEGYVVVEFTVTTLGTVIDPHVIEADPPGIFDRAAMQAVTKFKYKPKMENGKPLEVKGVRNIIRFELDKSGR